MNLVIEMGGGLGDIFYQMADGGRYNSLQDLKPGDHAQVILITHNPHAVELFQHHPKSSQIKIIRPGYWLPCHDAENRARHKLPQTTPFPHKDGALQFYPHPTDAVVLSKLPGKYVVFAASAGLPDRSLPDALIESLTCAALAHGLWAVFVGRSFSRHDRYEKRPPIFTSTDGLSGGVIDAIDRLSVPGVCSAVQNALAVVCCYSSIKILSWLLRKPTFLLYPASVADHHVAKRDQWAFGIDYPEVQHARFDDYREHEACEFFSGFGKLQWS